jgi:hypothetical protein
MCGRELCGPLCGSHAHGHYKHATSTAVFGNLGAPCFGIPGTENRV